MVERSIPAFVVASALSECINIASAAEEVQTLRKLVEIAAEMGLIKVNERDDDGDAVRITWVSQQHEAGK